MIFRFFIILTENELYRINNVAWFKT